MTQSTHSTCLALGLRADPGTVPLLIGVIGHRDPLPTEIPRIVKQFELLLERIIEACPSTPIWMLNGLAEGMDSIAAETFLTRARLALASDDKHEQSSIRDKLIAVLPKNREEYSKDFGSKAAKQKLQKLLDESDTILDPSNSHELRNSFDAALSEPECYAIQGEFVAKYSYILFAFFDGIDTGRIGGTAHTLAIHQGNIHPLFRSAEEVLRSREEGEAVIIDTPRICNASQREPRQNQQISQQLSTGILETCRYLDSINVNISNISFRPTQYDEIEGPFTKLWSYSDRVAGFWKKRYEKIAILLVIMGFLLVATVDFYGKASAFGWGLVFVAFSIFPAIQKKLQKPFLTHRCLTESLTIQYIWSANDIKASTADLLFSHDQDDIARIRVLLRTVTLQLMIIGKSEQAEPEESLTKSRIWIRGQIVFLSKRVGSFKSLSKRWKAIAYLFAGGGIASASINLIPIGIAPPEYVVNVLLAGFTSSLAYQELMGYKQTYERYEISLRQFERAYAALSYLDDGHTHYLEETLDSHFRYKLVLDAIGKEKIDELNEWMSNQLEKSYQPA